MCNISLEIDIEEQCKILHIRKELNFPQHNSPLCHSFLMTKISILKPFPHKANTLLYCYL